jgi:hypothetical protein
MGETEAPHKKLFLAEFAEELKGLLHYCGSQQLSPREFLVVALQPEVKVLCKEKEINYIDTLPFFDTGSHQRVLSKSHELTTLFSTHLSFNVPAAVQPMLMDTFIFYSRFYINNYLWIIEVMEGIKKKYKDIDIFVYRRTVVPGTSDPRRDAYLLKRDRFLDTLVEKYCRDNKNQLKVQVIEQPQVGANKKKKLKNGWVKKILKTTARKLFQKKLNTLSRFKTVFIAAPSYNLDRVCRDIRTKFPGVLVATHLHLPGTMPIYRYLRLCLKELKNRLVGQKPDQQLIAIPVDLFTPKPDRGENTVLNQLKESYKKFAADYRQQFSYEGCLFWEEFNRKVEVDLLDTLGWLLESAEGRRRFLKILKPKLVISPVSTAEYQSWAEVCKSLGIPALVIPQKTLVKPANEFARTEEYYIGRAQVTDSFQNAAAQSPLVTRYLKWTGYKGNLIETGNLIFSRIDVSKRKEKQEQLFRAIGNKKKIIVWAPSMKTRKSRRFYVLESIDELLSAMQEVFDVVSQMEDMHLIFRIHPGGAVTKDEIYSLLDVPVNVSVSDSGAFEDVLAPAHLLVSFSSTAVQEALVNHIPVLLYDKWNRYNHLDADSVENPVPAKVASAYYINKKEYLAASIPWILEEHTKKDVTEEIFGKYVFLNDHFKNFINFVEKCLST